MSAYAAALQHAFPELYPCGGQEEAAAAASGGSEEQPQTALSPDSASAKGGASASPQSIEERATAGDAAAGAKVSGSAG